MRRNKLDRQRRRSRSRSRSRNRSGNPSRTTMRVASTLTTTRRKTGNGRRRMRGTRKRSITRHSGRRCVPLPKLICSLLIPLQAYTLFFNASCWIKPDSNGTQAGRHAYAISATHTAAPTHTAACGQSFKPRSSSGK